MTEAAWTLSADESCAGGLASSRMVSVPGSGEWFRGGRVAYDPEVKFGLLSVERGPVIRAETARQMATGVSALLGTAIGVGITGVAGPEPEEGMPVGKAFIGVDDGVHRLAMEHRLVGNPEQVRAEAVVLAVRAVIESRQRLLAGASA